MTTLRNRAVFFCFLFSSILYSQNPTYQQKLYYACKVWGFVKYYHSAVSTCQVDWDSVLVADLPLIKNAATQNDFNDALDTMLNAAGPMQIAVTAPPAPLSPELRRNADFNWINDPMLRNDVQVILDTIRNNFRPHAECWVEENQYTNSYTGWLVFPFDSLMSNVSAATTFPDEWNRGLLLFKYWNIIRYFNPYNYVWDRSIDSTLFDYDSLIVSAIDLPAFFLNLNKMSAQLNDAHVEALTWTGSIDYPDGGYCGAQIIAKYIPGKYVIVKSSIPTIYVGDEIMTVNGLTTSQWEDSLSPYISAGNSDVFRREVARDMLAGPYLSSITISTKDSVGVIHTNTRWRSVGINTSWFNSYYPNDTLGTTTYKLWSCNVGYVNMGQLQIADVNQMYSDLRNTTAIIIDLRNYPNGEEVQMADFMYPDFTLNAKFMQPDVTFPGTFSWQYQGFGVNGNSLAYNGKVIILMNERTQSQAEYSCMIFDEMPDVIKVGSQTAGTDGNVTFFRLTPDIHTGFTSLGWFYQNGDSTERIGIVPDSVIYPTQVGIRHHRDEILEKALEIAQCWTSVPEQTFSQSSFSVFPNPSNGLLNIHSTYFEGKISISITDLTGRVVSSVDWESNNGELNYCTNISSLSSGIYLVQLRSANNVYSLKFVRE